MGRHWRSILMQARPVRSSHHVQQPIWWFAHTSHCPMATVRSWWPGREHRWQVLLHAACQQRPVVMGAETSHTLCNSGQPLYNLCLLAAWRPAGSTGGGCSCRQRSRGNRSSTP